MSQYYFAVASLPHLDYDMEKIPTVEQFLETCENNLKPEHLKLIKSAAFDNLELARTNNKILNNWLAWEKNLRNNLVVLRAENKNEPPEKYLREDQGTLLNYRFISEAYESDSPLNAEDILNLERWSYLDEIEVGHHFDEIKLLVYYIKLQILWRKQSLNKEKGTRKFSQLLELPVVSI
ncbi:MAG: DUF2764 family protein [Spirochaetes bacterium]|nr:DUF2764 family protein [Spirochaetota bacterium]